jgi:hypothetical protein
MMRGEALCAAIAAAMRMNLCNSASRFGPRAASKMLTLQRYCPSVQASNESYRCRVCFAACAAPPFGSFKRSSCRSASRRGIMMFNMPDKIADQFDVCSGSVCEKIDAHKFVFDHYHQLKLIEPIKTEIVT